jgi:hypothetical protein
VERIVEIAHAQHGVQILHDLTSCFSAANGLARPENT